MLLHFRIQIAGVTKPPVWRELTVPASFTFLQFHRVIQVAFGWADMHLWFFSPDGFPSDPWIKFPDEEDAQSDIKVLHAQKTKLMSVFPANQKYTYTYDFGDDWLHKIKLLRISEGTAKHALLTAGKGGFLPEDCGGPPGYERIKDILKNPADPEFEDICDWLGMEADMRFDPAYFDLKETQELVAGVR